MYSIQNNVTDGPTDPWGMLTVFTSKKANNHYVRQDFSASSGGVFSRLGIKANNQGLKWGPWNKIGVVTRFYQRLKGYSLLAKEV
ncbi:MAG: hypothetical protein ACLSH6_00945 [Limosilactobacillus pontis]